MKKFFACYIEGSGDEWQAICVDFDIAVAGRSLEETKALIEFAVRSYVDDAMREAEPTRSQLLARRAPLSVRLAWRLKVALAGLRFSGKIPNFEGHFAIACHA